MKSLKLMSVVTMLALGVMVAGCSQQKAATASEAIEQSKAQGTVEKQVDYLVGQAQAFVSSKNYDQAITVANHILANLDQNSEKAKQILEKAKADMKAVAEGAVNDMKNAIGNVGK